MICPGSFPAPGWAFQLLFQASGIPATDREAADQTPMIRAAIASRIPLNRVAVKLLVTAIHDEFEAVGWTATPRWHYTVPPRRDTIWSSFQEDLEAVYRDDPAAKISAGFARSRLV